MILRSIYKRTLSVVFRMIVVIIVLLGVTGGIGGIFGVGGDSDVQAGQTESIYFERYGKFDREDWVQLSTGIWENDSTDEVIIFTEPYSQDIFGYSDVIPLLIYVNDDDEVITKIEVLENSETKRFLGKVLKSGMIEKFIGLSPAEAVDSDVEIVTRATMSSSAIQDSLRAGLRAYLEVPEDGRRSAIHFVHKVINSTPTIVGVCAILVTLFCSVLIKGNPIVRIGIQIMNIAIIGVYCTYMISMSAIFGWVGSGLTQPLQFVGVFALFVTLVLYIFGKPKFYCNWVCPFGGLQELIGRFKIKRVTLPSWVVKNAKLIREGVLLALLVYSWLVGSVLIFHNEPFSIFVISYASVAVIIIGVVTMIASLFVGRVWCRFCCPTGAVLDWVQKK